MNGGARLFGSDPLPDAVGIAITAYDVVAIFMGMVAVIQAGPEQS